MAKSGLKIISGSLGKRFKNNEAGLRPSPQVAPGAGRFKDKIKGHRQSKNVIDMKDPKNQQKELQRDKALRTIFRPDVEKMMDYAANSRMHGKAKGGSELRRPSGGDYKPDQTFKKSSQTQHIKFKTLNSKKPRG